MNKNNQKSIQYKFYIVSSILNKQYDIMMKIKNEKVDIYFEFWILQGNYHKIVGAANGRRHFKEYSK